MVKVINTKKLLQNVKVKNTTHHGKYPFHNRKSFWVKISLLNIILNVAN